MIIKLNKLFLMQFSSEAFLKTFETSCFGRMKNNKVFHIAVPQFEEVQKLQNANFECPRNFQFLRKPAGFF